MPKCWYHPHPNHKYVPTALIIYLAHKNSSDHILMKNTARAPRPSSGPETVHLPAPACMFSKGLPFPFAGGLVSLEPPADVEDALCIEDAACVGTGLSVELARPSTVEVTMSPVLIPVGPMTIGTMTWSVFPSLSVVVLVRVDLIVLVKSSPSSLPVVV